MIKLFGAITLSVLMVVCLPIANAANLPDDSIQIADSPFTSIKAVDYAKVRSELDRIFGTDIALNRTASFRSNREKRKWLDDQIEKYPTLISILPIQSSTSMDSFVKILNFGNERAKELFITGPQADINVLTQKPIETLFGFRIQLGSAVGKKNVLIWAKEHANELNVSEFVINLSEFILKHLSSDPSAARSQYYSQILKDIFSKINLIVLPDMTPDKNFETYLPTEQRPYGGSGGMSDANWFGLWLQPFDYDSTSPALAAAAPEAVFFKNVISSLDHVVIGVDIHSPFGITTHTVQGDSVGDNASYLAGEGTFTQRCRSGYHSLGAEEEEITCKEGVVRTESPISISVNDSASYLSRTRQIPTLFLEMEVSMSDAHKPGCDSIICSKNGGMTYVDRERHLSHYLPLFTRLMEIAAKAL